ncbi:MAG: nicotinamide mononucleotide transporter [Legionellales bacterium]|nr:nicotinamide mononucleotide transporter [Legionellales bacterium]
MNYLDLIGTILSLIGTFYFVKANIKMWPIYILAIGINSVLYFQYKMYASLLLENMYLCVSIYGWYFWNKTSKHTGITINEISSSQILSLIFLWGIIIYGLCFLMIRYTDTSFPLVEAVAVGTSIVAQMLSSRKIIECWYAWIIADSVFIYLMFYQSLYFHAFLFMCYLVLAVIGLANWTKLRKCNILTVEQNYA